MEKKNIIKKHQEIKIRLVSQSKNEKTGNISQTYTSCGSCPKCCPFNKDNENKDGVGCYAATGHCALAWKKVEQYGVAPKDFKELLENTPHTNVIRHNVAGDLATPGTNDIDAVLLNHLVNAYKNLKAYTYTHCETSDKNLQLAKLAQHNGFVINFSTEKIENAKKVLEYGLNAVIAVNTMEKDVTVIDDVKVVKCPAEAGKKDKNGDKMTCKMCGICWRKNREFVIAFPAHGTKANVNKIKKSGFLMDI